MHARKRVKNKCNGTNCHATTLWPQQWNLPVFTHTYAYANTCIHSILCGLVFGFSGTGFLHEGSAPVWSIFLHTLCRFQTVSMFTNSVALFYMNRRKGNDYTIIPKEQPHHCVLRTR